MPDQVVTETDSTTEPTIPQGTGATGNDPSQNADATAGAQAAPKGFDEEWLKTLDPASRQSFEERFVPKAAFTQKTQALAEDRKRFEAEKAAVFELARKAIADRQAPTGPSAEDLKMKELQELAAAGDGNAMSQLTDMMAERKVAPIRTQMALQNAAQSARTNPLAGQAVTEHWNEIVQTIQSDPVIANIAKADNYAFADKVMIALGLEHQVRDLMPKYETATKTIAELQAKLQAYEKERVTGLPSSTTRAGTTAGRPAAGELTSLEDIAAFAWKESGGRPEDLR